MSSSPSNDRQFLAMKRFMKRRTPTQLWPDDRRRGAIVMLVVMCLPVVLIFSAFAINVAWMQLTRTELRTATDAAARAASRTLSISQDPAIARAAGKNAASRNTVAGTPLVMADADIQFGSSNPLASGKWDFNAQSDSSTELTGVRVTGDRTAGSGSGAVPMLFSSILNNGVFEPVKTATASQIDRDVFLVLDRSGSMAISTPGSNRWLDLKKAVKAFLKELEKTPQDELVGVVTYASTSTLDESMKLNYEQLISKIDTKGPSGATAIGMGLQDGITGVTNTAFARPQAAKTIVVMTDGYHNTGIDPTIVAANAKALGIVVHTITFSTGANQSHMQTVAQNGGGKHWHANDPDELISVFREVANNLPTLLTE